MLSTLSCSILTVILASVNWNNVSLASSDRLSTLSNMAPNYSRLNFNYSMKNIAIPTKNEYLMQLIYSVEKFVRNLRWRAFFYLHPEKRGREKETFGFNSIRALEESIPELKLFEQRLIALVRDVQFRKFTNEFQEKI